MHQVHHPLRVLELQPNHVPSYKALAQLARRTGAWEGALPWLCLARDAAPNDPVVHFDLATCYRRIGLNEFWRDGKRAGAIVSGMNLNGEAQINGSPVALASSHMQR